MTNVIYAMLWCVALQAPTTIPVGSHDYENLVKRALSEYWNGRLVESEALLTAALRSLPSDDEIRRAHTLTDLGDVYVSEDELQKAEHHYLVSLEIYKKTPDTNSVTVLLQKLGGVYSLERRDDEALRVLQNALKRARAAPETDAALIGQVLNSLGVVYYRQRDFKKAEKFFTEEMQILPDVDSLYGKADVLNNLGAIYHARHEFEKAEEYFKKALNRTEDQVGVAHPDLTFSLSLLAMLYTQTGRYADAEEQYQRALRILDVNEPVFETRIARLLDGLSKSYAAAGRKTDAEAMLSRAAGIARRNVDAHPDMAMIMDAYAATLKKGGKVKEAEELRVEAKRARIAAGLVVSAHTPF
jgi:tetratricopeptide (TPR) repeat protein